MQKLTPQPEPKRQKVHWDFLLEEMVWLQKEFTKYVSLHRMSKQHPAFCPTERRLSLMASITVQPGHHCCRERVWKLQQAKKFARHAQRSDMDIESRALKRVRQEQQAIRKVAAGIAKEVSKLSGEKQL